MKILILGALGNLGSQLVDEFQKNDHETYGWDRPDLDLTDKETTEKKIKDLAPEIIINAVAYNAVDRCEEDEKEYELAKILNIDVPGRLAEIAQDIKAIFVHYSSDYVFAGDSRLSYTEKSPTDPINKYGQTKAEGEKAIARVALAGLKWYLIRTSKLFGPKGKSELAKPSFFDTMLKLAEEKDEIKVVDDEKSCFTYTPDLALATRNLIEQALDHGIYHITNSEPATWYEACNSLFSLANINKKVVPVSADEFPRPAKRPKRSQLINTKTAHLRTYQQALEQYLNTT